LFSLACFSICLFFIDSLVGIFFAAILFFAIFFLAKVKPLYVFVSVWPIYVVAAITLFFSCVHFDFFSGNLAGFIVFNLDLVPNALVVSSRFLLSVWASMLFCLTTAPTDVTFALAWILQPLRRFKVPVDDISMVVSIAIRFIPLAIAEFCEVRDSMLMRGAMLYCGGPLVRVKAWCNVLVAFLIGMFRRAETLAQSLDVRGYGAFECRRSTIREYSFNGASIIFAALFAVYMSALAIFF
jgi:energy-coupling factor transport system permease protein